MTIDQRILKLRQRVETIKRLPLFSKAGAIESAVEELLSVNEAMAAELLAVNERLVSVNRRLDGWDFNRSAGLR